MSDRGERRNGILGIFPYFDTHSSSGFFRFFFFLFLLYHRFIVVARGRKGCEEQRNSEEKKNRGGYKRASSITIVTLSLVVSRCNVNLASGDSLQSRRLSLLRDPIPGMNPNARDNRRNFSNDRIRAIGFAIPSYIYV